MGFLGFGRKKKKHEPKWIWLDEEAKWRKVMQGIAESVKNDAVIVVPFFIDSGFEVVDRLAQLGIEAVASESLPARQPGPGKVHVVPSVHLKGSLPGPEDVEKIGDPVQVFFIEISPIHDEERFVYGLVDGLRYPVKISHYISVDDPLLSLFVTETTKAALISLGMNEDNPTRSKMIDKSIRRAQEKLRQRVGDNPGTATNALEWIKINNAG